MKSLSISVAFALALITQPAVAQPTPLIRPGMAPNLTGAAVPKYEFVLAKVAPGVMFANPAPAKSFNPQANSAAWTVLRALPARD